MLPSFKEPPVGATPVAFRVILDACRLDVGAVMADRFPSGMVIISLPPCLLLIVPPLAVGNRMMHREKRKIT